MAALSRVGYGGSVSRVGYGGRLCGRARVQDAFISFLLRMHEMHSCLEVMQKMDRWIAEVPSFLPPPPPPHTQL